MSEREAFLHAICENPEDDAARLVFADWLQEHGEEERAEFIRVQIELAGAETFSSHVSAWTTRQNRLLRANQQRWLAELPFQGSLLWDYHFQRGFVESVRAFDFAVLRREVDRIFAATPLIHLELHRPCLSELTEIRELSRIRYLGIWISRPSAESVRRFVAGDNLTALEQIAIRGPTIDFALEDLLVERFGPKLQRN
jgi:uncharacterized protein (TIGR02996 family)